MTDSLKARLAAGETLYGTFLSLGSPLAAEACGVAGLDWLLVDLEHGGGDESLLLAQLLAARSAGVPALVRVESGQRSRVLRALDLGADGIMFPQVHSTALATEWCAHLHYGPLGTRGVALGHRGARFGMEPDAIGRAGDRTVGIAQIESPEAVEEVEGIAAVEAIDVLFVGPNDLSFAIGCFQQFDDPRFRAALERVVAAARDSGKAAGIMCFDGAGARAAVADGFRFIALSSDSSLLVKGVRQALADAR
jgi:2-keto-3-deoxy-L-rhamnonate aldolase RhmA